MDGLLMGSYVVLWGIVLAVGFLLLGTLRSLARLSWRLDQFEAVTPSRVGRSGLKSGTRAPDFTLQSVNGAEVSLRDFAGRQVLLILVQPGCGPCNAVVPELNKLCQKDEVQVVAICNGDAGDVRGWAEKVGPRFTVLRQDNWSISRRYEMFATPFAFLIDGEGVVRAKGIINKEEHIKFLLSSAGDAVQGQEAEPVLSGPGGGDS